MKKRLRQKRVGIVVSIDKDTKDKKQLELIADRLRKEEKVDNWLKRWKRDNHKT